MKRRGSYLTSSVDDSLAPSSSKHSKLDLQKPQKSGVSETEDAFLYLRKLFPVGAFDASPTHQLPPIVLKHQLYALLSDRTSVDRELQSLIDNGRVRQFKLGVSESDYVLMLADDYVRYVKSRMGESALSKRLIQVVLPSCKNVSISKEQLSKRLKLTEENISVLVNNGILLVRDVGRQCSSWWFAIPGILKKSKYKELLRSELLSRKLTVSKLPMEFHVHDVIGADLVERVETSSGVLLRLVEYHQQRQDTQ